MKQYLLSIYQPSDSPPPPPEMLDPIMRRIHELQTDMKDAGVLMFTGGLHPPSTATVVRATPAEMLITDGPFIEGKEHLGGFLIIQVADLDQALAWAKKLAAIVLTLSIEVRPFQNVGA